MATTKFPATSAGSFLGKEGNSLFANDPCALSPISMDSFPNAYEPSGPDEPHNAVNEGSGNKWHVPPPAPVVVFRNPADSTLLLDGSSISVEALYDAIRDFEVANSGYLEIYHPNVTPVYDRAVNIANEEAYTAHVNAYNRYVAISYPHIVREHLARFIGDLNDDELYLRYSNVVFAAVNGLSKDQIDYMIGGGIYDSPLMNDIRNGFERGLSERAVESYQGYADPKTRKLMLDHISDKSGQSEIVRYMFSQRESYSVVSITLDLYRTGKVKPDSAAAIANNLHTLDVYARDNALPIDLRVVSAHLASLAKRLPVFEDFDFLARDFVSGLKRGDIGVPFCTGSFVSYIDDFFNNTYGKSGNILSVTFSGNQINAGPERGAVMSGNAAHSVRSVKPADEVSDEKEKLTGQLLDGVKNVMESGNFKSYLNTCGRLLINNYNVNNAILVWLQKPGARYVMGYDAWKEFGRNVKRGATGAKIFVPVMAKEKTRGGLANAIRKNLADQIRSDPGKNASHKVGTGGLAFTMNKSGLIGVTVNGKESGLFNNDAEFRKYIDKNILGKIPMYFSVGSVFDEKDVMIPEYLWVKRDFDKGEVIRDEKGKPIINNKGETKIANTPERQARFVSSIGIELSAQDPAKMEVLLNAATALCASRGVGVVFRGIDEDPLLKSGADGYYQPSPLREPGNVYTPDMAGRFPGGMIVVGKNTSAIVFDDLAKQAATLFHEMAHASLHKKLDRTASEMGVDSVALTHPMLEQQAQAVSYAVCSQFGIDSGKFSFEYMAAYTAGFELKDLHMSLGVIHKESKALFYGLKAEIDKSGYTLTLDPKPKEPLTPGSVKTLCQSYVDYALSQENIASSVMSELPGLVVLNKDSPQLMGILADFKKNAEMRQESVGIIKSEIEMLSHEKTRSGQDACIASIIKAQERISRYAVSYDSLMASFISINYALRGGVKAEFEKDPKSTLYNLGTDKKYNLSDGSRKRLLDLTSIQLDYLSTSKFVRANSKMLRNDIEGFVNMVCDRASQLAKCSSRNGTFVEVSSCENWFDKPIFVNGTICHPKIADAIIKSSELQIRSMKEHSVDNGFGYVPYVKCDITVYSPTASNGLAGANTKIDIGDGQQIGLNDHMSAATHGSSGVQAEVYSNFVSAMHDRSFKDKMYCPDTIRNNGDFFDVSVPVGKSLDKYRVSIDSERAVMQNERPEIGGQHGSSPIVNGSAIGKLSGSKPGRVH